MSFVSKSVDRSIKKVIEAYYKRKYLSLATLKLDEGLKNCFLKDNSRLSELDKLDIIIQFRNNKSIDFTFDNFKYELKYLSIKVDNKNAYVVLIENHSINYNCCRKVTSKMMGLKHNIKLQKIDNKWIFISDDYLSDLDFLINRNKNKKSNVEIKKSIIEELNEKRILNINKGRGFKVCKVKDKYIEEKAIFDFVDRNKMFKQHYYSRENAAAYAKRYAFRYNDKYKNYDDYGGDCTNFASQCIHAGGIPFDTVGENKWYWYSDSSRVPSWTSARALRRYLLNNKGNTKTFGVNAYETTFEEIELGDLVQFEEPTHTMVVTGAFYSKEGKNDPWKNKYEILITQHSSDDSGRLLDYPLSLKPANKGRFYIKIESFYR